MMLPQIIIQIVTALIQNFPLIIQAVLELFVQLLSHLGDFGVQIIQWIITNIPIFIQNIITFISELPGKIWEWLLNVVEKLAQWIVEMNIKAIKMGTEFLQNIINFFKQLPGKVWEWLKSTISKVIQFAVEMAQKGNEGAKNLFNNIINTIKELPSKMLDMGKNIVEGIWNGIKNATSWIVNKVKEFAKSIFDGMKNALGIHSPSTLFRDGIGKFIPSGVAVGIDANTDAALQAINNMDDAIINQMHKSVVLETGKVNAKTKIEANNNQLTIITIDNKIEGNVDMDSTKVGRLTAPTVSKTIRVSGGGKK